MRTTLDIDEALMSEAQQVGGTKTKRETVERALEEFIAARRRDQLRGMLGKTDVALSLADGTAKWRRELGEQDSTVPFYGYTTSPIVAGKHLIVATGGEGHAVTAFRHRQAPVLHAAVGHGNGS